LVLPTLEIHRDKKIWGEDALEFKPERFESENFRKIHPYAYFPFSGGARMCPGYKYAMITMKIFISRFIMKYRVTTNMKYEDLKFIFSFTTDYKQRPLLRLSKR
jgi:cytochrome P450 family 4